MVKTLFSVALGACLLASGFCQSSVASGSAGSGGAAVGGGNVLPVLSLGDLLNLGGATSGGNPITSVVNSLNGVVGSISGGLPLPALPDFNSIINKALAAISSIQASALGPNGPINRAKDVVTTAQGVLSKLSPQVLNSTVTQATKALQTAINQASKGLNVSINPEAARQCIANAQKSLNEIVPQVVNGISSCSAPFSRNISSILQQSVAFYFGIPVELGKAGINAVLTCARSILSPNNGIEKCFDQAVAEVKGYVDGTVTKIDNGFSTLQSLIQEVDNCVSAGIQQAEKNGQALEAQLNACLAG